MHLPRSLALMLTALALAACGGGGGSEESNFTITRTLNGFTTSYSCPSQTSFDACRADSCSACTCVSGCSNSTNTPLARLLVTATPTDLPAGQSAAVVVTMRNPAAVPQTVAYRLDWPTGPVSYSAVGFSAGCTALSSQIGSTGLSVQALIDANTTACTWTFQKTPVAVGANQAFSLSNLSRIEVEGSLPALNVSAP